MTASFIPSHPRTGSRTSAAFEPGELIAGSRRVLRIVADKKGEGAIYLVWDEELECEGLLWVLPRILRSNAVFVAELDHLVHRIRSVVHPHIARVHEMILDPEWFGVVFEAIDGVPLSQLIEQSATGFLEVQRISPWMEKAGTALHDAHEEGLLHGDVCPDNIWVLRNGEVKVLNFEISRLVKSTLGAELKPTSSVNPQGVDDKRRTVADDVYGLGTTIFYLLTGSHPFSPDDLAARIREGSPPQMEQRRRELHHAGEEIPRKWEETVARALAKRPEARPATVEVMLMLLGLGSNGIAGVRKDFVNRTVPTPPQPGNTKSGAHLNGSNQKPRSSAYWRTGILSITVAGSLALFVTHPGTAHKLQPAPALEMSEADSIAAEVPLAVSFEASTPAFPEPSPEVLPLPEPSPDSTASPEATSEPVPLPETSGATMSVDEIVFPGNLPVAKPTPLAVPVSYDFENSLGMRFVRLGELRFSIWPTRVRDFGYFLGESGYRPAAFRDPNFKQEADHPVVLVSWQDAMAFCDWLTKKERKAGILPAEMMYRLPTDLEWSRAAGLPPESGATPEARDMKILDRYPWGTTWPPPPGAGNYCGEESGGETAVQGYDDGYPWTSPVGAFQPNANRIYDLGGNVGQWTMDWFNAAQRNRTLRGGSWQNGALKLSLLSSCRIQARPDATSEAWGFRVVMAPVAKPRRVP